MIDINDDGWNIGRVYNIDNVPHKNNMQTFEVQASSGEYVTYLVYF